MKYSNKFKKIISFILIFNFLFIQTLNAANITGIDSTERTMEVSEDMIRSDTPSDLPVAAVSDFFDEEKIDLIKNFDLSNFQGKKIFVGYGVFDKGQDNCKFVEMPNVTELSFDSNFAVVKSFNQHSYGISMNRITYAECKAKADQFGGYPVVIDSMAENGFVRDNFTLIDINNYPVEKIWIGATKNDCSLDLYTNELNNNQNYVNWESTEVAVACDTTKQNIKQISSGDWIKTGGSVPAYCVVEFENENPYKPLKICAPWWKIIREYPNDSPGLYSTEELKRINQADIPATLNICTLYSNEGIDAAENQDSTRLAHCTEYDSRTVAPECVRNPNQPQCHVNECGGYIETACVLQKTDTVGKGYVKGEVLIDGTVTEVKVKENIVTNEYICPAAGPSEAYCLEHSVVTIYPKECPNSSGAYQCQELKECILRANVPSASQTRDNIDDCYSNYDCIKIIGGRDLPPILNASGEVTALQAKCPAPPISDNSVLEFPVNVQKKYGKKCLEYEEIQVDENVTQKCKLNKNFSNHTVDMSITQEDIYEDDPNCLRTDTVQESLTEDEIVFTITNKNYFKINISKVFLDGNVSNIYNGGSDDYTLVAAMPISLSSVETGATQEVTEITTSGSGSTTGSSSTNVDCSFTDPTVVSDWFNKNIAVFLEGSSPNYTLDNSFSVENLSGSTGDIMIPDSVIGNDTDTETERRNQCANYASNHGFGSYLNSYTYSYNSNTGVDSCTLHLNKVSSDSLFSEIQSLSLDANKYTFKNQMSGLDCLKKAYCMNGYYNEGDFGSDTSIGTCIVTTGESSPSEYTDKILEEAGIEPSSSNSETLPESDVIPTETIEQVPGNFRMDGLESIIILEDYVRGGFGYYSNYNSWPSKANSVIINTANISDGILPFRPISKINDMLNYNGILEHGSHLSKDTDEAAAFVGGALTGAALYASAVASAAAASAGMTTVAAMLPALGATGIGIIVVLVIIVLLILLSKPKQMDRQITEYHVYRDVPLELFDPSQYETRYNGEEAAVQSERSLHNDPSGYKRMTFYHDKTDTGRYERSDFMEALNAIKDMKYNSMLLGGIKFNEIDRLTHNDEKSINYGYPSCPWYKPWCEKTDMHYNQVVTNENMVGELVSSPAVPELGFPFNLTSKTKMLKETDTIYIGATNTLVILVPFIGDYKVEAYNKYDTLLSSRTLVESAFAGVTDPNDLKFAQVNFGISMNLAPGLSPGDNIDACRKDRAVEWGGGVSGVFFENQRTDLSTYCQKSNNEYLKDQSMTKIYIQPLNLDRGFSYELIKPMPFPNRVWIATLDNKEVRNYRCFDDFGECEDDSFQEVE
jgi:hypothetical protein